MSIFIKICGVTNLKDAKASLRKGADAIGFIQSKKSERFVTLETLKGIKNGIGTNFLTIPVFVNPSICLLYTSPSPRDGLLSRMPSSA